MGRYKFRLSDMIPRAWLRKLNHPGSTLSNPKALLPHLDDDRLCQDHNRLPPTPPPPLSPLNQAHQRKSYHFSRQFDALHPCCPPSPPKMSTTTKHRRSAHLRRPTRRSTPRWVASAVSAGCSCRTLANFDPVRAKPECQFPISPPSSLSSTDAIYPQSTPSFGHSSGSVPSSESFDQMVSWTTTSSSCRCRTDLDDSVMLDDNPLFELELPEVITKPPEFNEMVMNLRKRGENEKPIATDHHKNSSSSRNSSSAVSAKGVEEETYNQTVRADKEQKKPRLIGNSACSPASGMRLRVNSPKLASRKLNRGHLQGRKSMNLGSTTRKSSVSDGFVVVKSSVDPWKDFMESMVEMIVEKDIRESKDLEELLACYLMLNSDEYHDLIVGVFKQIWFDFYHARLK